MGGLWRYDTISGGGGGVLRSRRDLEGWLSLGFGYRYHCLMTPHYKGRNPLSGDDRDIFGRLTSKFNNRSMAYYRTLVLGGVCG